MNVPLVRALAALVPMSLLLSGSTILFLRRKGVRSLVQVIGAGCLVVVVLTHVCEALHWLAWMRWGDEYSVGHYLDLSSAVLGVALFPIGYFLDALAIGERRGAASS